MKTTETPAQGTQAPSPQDPTLAPLELKEITDDLGAQIATARVELLAARKRNRELNKQVLLLSEELLRLRSKPRSIEKKKNKQ